MQSIQLQAIGHVPAKPAQDFQPGDVMIWNFGSTSRVLAVVKETAAFITFAIRDDKGQDWERKLKKSRLVGWKK